MTEDETNTTDDASVHERLDRLESVIEDQRETIAAQQERLARQGALLERVGHAVDVADGPDAGEGGSAATLPVDRRGVLKTGGLLGLLGLGTGTAAAAPGNGGQGGGTGGGPSNSPAINWADADGDGLLEPADSSITGIDVADVEVDGLAGGVTGGAEVTSLLGDGLTASGGALTAALGNALDFDGSGRIALQPGTVDHDSLSGIDPGDHHTRPSAGDGLTDESDAFDVEPAAFAGNALEDDGNDNLAVASGAIDDDELAESSVTVAGNTVTLGGSTGIAHGDLDGIAPDDHHAKDHDHAGSDVSAVPNAGLANDSVSVAGNQISLGGATGIAHGDLDGIAPDDHHARPSAGTALAEDGGAFDVRASEIDHDDLANAGRSDAHHTRPSAGEGLNEDANAFDVDTDGTLSVTAGSLGIAGDAVGSNELASGAVGSPEIADGSVGTDELAAGSVTESELADGASAIEVGGSRVDAIEVSERLSVSVDGGTATLDISREAIFEVSIDNVEFEDFGPTLLPNRVDCTIRNTGFGTETQEITLDGEFKDAKQTKSVELGTFEETSVSFGGDPFFPAAIWRLVLTSEDDRDTTTLDT